MCVYINLGHKTKVFSENVMESMNTKLRYETLHMLSCAQKTVINQHKT